MCDGMKKRSGELGRRAMAFALALSVLSLSACSQRRKYHHATVYAARRDPPVRTLLPSYLDSSESLLAESNTSSSSSSSPTARLTAITSHLSPMSAPKLKLVVLRHMGDDVMPLLYDRPQLDVSVHPAPLHACAHSL